jgi:hypothetical protein
MDRGDLPGRATRGKHPAGGNSFELTGLPTGDLP